MIPGKTRENPNEILGSGSESEIHEDSTFSRPSSGDSYFDEANLPEWTPMSTLPASPFPLSRRTIEQEDFKHASINIANQMHVTVTVTVIRV